MRKICTILMLTVLPLAMFAQQYTGMSGLIHVPSADMDSAGDIRIGSHFLNREFLPDKAFEFNGSKYHSVDFYASITPFPWIEIGYTFTLRKGSRGDWDPEATGYNRKDQYFSLKLRPLSEKPDKWWPSIAIGTNDPKTGDDEHKKVEKNRNRHFGNYYITASKHYMLWRQEFGIHLAYRWFKRTYNRKWNGVVGGITYRPSFAPAFRGIVEYTGNDINAGIDCLLWRHLRMQVSLQNGKYFTGGLCYQVNLL